MSTSAQAGHENRAVLEKRDGRVATLTLNRPERMNALNADLIVALNEALTRAEAEPKAAELFDTGEVMTAAEALRIGIVNRVVPLAQLETEAHALAHKIANGPAIAIHAIKEVLFGRDKEELTELLDLEVEQQME